MYIADYTNGGAKRPATLTISKLVDCRRHTLSTHVVANKREARQLAAQLGAKPWNF